MTVNDAASATYEVIGVVRSPHKRLEGMPLQSVAAQNAPDTQARWLVVGLGDDPEHPDGGIATVDALP